MNRLGFIGGSDIAVIMGVSPYKTALQLYFEKRGEIEEEDLSDNQRVHFGNVLEAVVAHEYSRRTSQKIRRVNVEIVDAEHDFLRGHIDRDVPNTRRILECKTADAFTRGLWGPDGTDSIPDTYILQGQHYLGLLPNKEFCDVAALIGGNDYRSYTLIKDIELIGIFREEAIRFWSMVQAGTPPEFQAQHPSSEKFLRRLYKVSDGSQIVMTEELQHWHAVYQQAKAKAKEYDTIADGARMHILEWMGNASRAMLPDGSYYERKFVHRKAFTVEESDFMDFRLVKPRKPKEKPE